MTLPNTTEDKMTLPNTMEVKGNTKTKKARFEFAYLLCFLAGVASVYVLQSMATTTRDSVNISRLMTTSTSNDIQATAAIDTGIQATAAIDTVGGDLEISSEELLAMQAPNDV